ncbi:MAG TPA: hypothetical protein ENI67_04770 [Gammaproteobacteria bacterium]|nr:hypothetical protein [Gammaproteobacteria bacterium]
MKYLAPLANRFVDLSLRGGVFTKKELCGITREVLRTFTPVSFRNDEHYEKHGYLLSIDNPLGYMCGVAAIAGADQSINVSLFTDLMQAINIQISGVTTKQLLIIIKNMVNGLSCINGHPVWAYNKDWNRKTYSIVNQYGEILEYFIIENQSSKFIEYNQTINEIVQMPSLSSLREQIYIKSELSDMPPATIVKKMKLIRVVDSVKLTTGHSCDDRGHSILNTIKPVFSLQVLRKPYYFNVIIEKTYIEAFDCFLKHLIGDNASIVFLKQLLAYHGKHLTNIPVILYVIGIGGSGKSHLAYMIEKLFGSNTTSRPSVAQIANKFNDYLYNTSVLILAETGDSSATAREGIKAVLKSITGERTIDIESKGLPIRCNMEIFALPVLISNEAWYNSDVNDRRLFCIAPKKTMNNSNGINIFENEHHCRIIDVIMEGIKKGIIAKHLTKYCPKELPEVPQTEAREQLIKSQLFGKKSNHINIIKELMENGHYIQLFNLMDKYNVELFFKRMDSSLPLNYFYQNELKELALRMGATNNKGFALPWLRSRASNIPNKTHPLVEQLGQMRWKALIKIPYFSWSERNRKEPNLRIV